MTTTTPDMNLVLPDVSVTAGPQWATLLNAAFTAVDSHDHSTGKGIKVTPSGLNISSDLSFVQNNATDLRSLRLYPNSVFSAGVNDKTCVYSLNGDLYYIDNTGVNIRITNNGTVDVNGAIQTLNIKDTGFYLQYFGDTTRQFRFDASAIPASTARVISMPDSGANDTLVTLAATQTIVNKTLTTPVLNNPSIANYANLSNSSAPATPGAGSSNIYVSNVDNQLHLVSSAGVDTAIGASSSSGKNYLQTYYGFALNPVTNAATSLTITGNRTASQGFFGTSSAVASTLLAYNTSSPLRAPGDLQFIIPSASSGVFIESPMFTLDVIDAGAGVQFISFEMNAATTGAAAGDALVSVIQYDSSGNYVATIQPSITQLPSGYAKFKAAFSPVSTASAKYSIRFTANTASARTIDIQNIIVGPQYATISDAVGAWQAFTPVTTNLGTISLTSAYYRRVGDSMEISATFQSGTASAAIATFQVPGGFTVGSSVPSNTSGAAGPAVGYYSGDGTGTSTLAGSMVLATATSNNNLYFGTPLASGGNLLYPTNGTQATANNAVMSLKATIPIAQWTSTVTLAGNANIEFASNTSTNDAPDTTSFANGATGSPLPGALTASRSKRIRFQTPIQPTDRIQVEISAGDGHWFNTSDINSSIQLPGAYQNNILYGVGFQYPNINTTDVTVTFGQYSYPSGATYGAAGGAWSSIPAGYRWRVAKYSAVGLAELAPVTATSSGYVTTGSLPGIPSNTAATTGMVGEIISSYVTSVNTTTGVTNATSITLSAGDWDISATESYAGAGAGFILLAVGTTSASTTGTTLGKDRVAINANSGSGLASGSVCFPVQLASSTTYYVNVSASAAETAVLSLFIFARRRR